MMEVSSQARIDYSYQLEEEKPLIHKTIYSNIVSVILTSNILSIERSVDKEQTEVYDTLIYTVFIHNLTQVPITNLRFTDQLTSALLLVPCSVSIDGMLHKTFHPQQGFTLAKLPALGSITVRYCVVVQSHTDTPIITKAELRFLFSSNRLLPAAPIELFSNKTITDISHSLFKVVHITNALILPDGVLRVPDIAGISVAIKPLKTKLVEAVVKQLPQKPTIPLLLLLFDASIEYAVTYRNQSVKRTCPNHYISAFRSYLFVPHGIRYGVKYEAQYRVTKVDYYIQCGKIICDVSLLLSLSP